MTYITGIFDKSSGRKEKFINDLEENLPGMVTRPLKRHDIADITFIWSLAYDAPLDFFKKGKDSYIYLGIQPNSPLGTNTAEVFAKNIESNTSNGIAFESDYFLGLKLTEYGNIEITADMLGFFPLYYWSSFSSDAFIFSTSPGAIPAYHSFKRKINYRTLAKILLVGYMADKETVWKDIYRLSPGYRLRWSPGSKVKEEKFNNLEFSDKYFGKKTEFCSKILDNNLNGVVKEIADGPPLTFMLSGGLDSRLIAGYLHKNKAKIRDINIIGQPYDLEVILAQKIAHKLNRDYEIVSSPFEDLLEYISDLIELEQCSYSLWAFRLIKVIPFLQRNKIHFTGGFFGDNILACQFLDRYCKSTEPGSSYFYDVLNGMTVWGFAPQVVKKILRISGNEQAVDEAIDSFKTSFDSYEGSDFQKTWMFYLLHRQRGHIAPYISRLSFGAWPRLPYLSPKILKTVSGFPLQCFRDSRFFEVNLLRKKFPSLAAVHLKGKTDKLLHPLTHPRNKLKHETKKYLTRFENNYLHKERRRYQSTIDINNDDWKKVRQYFENFRKEVDSLFDPVMVNKLIPLPTEKIDFKNKNKYSAGIKNLMMLSILLLRVKKL